MGVRWQPVDLEEASGRWRNRPERSWMGGEGWEPSLEWPREQPSIRTYFPSSDLRTVLALSFSPAAQLTKQTAPRIVCAGYAQLYRPGWVPWEPMGAQ